MSNSFGSHFKFTTWGESHGKAIGCVIDGAPSNIDLNEDYIQHYLDQRKPGQLLTSKRKENDIVQILSGVLDNKTIGTPISLMILNKDHNKNEYNNISETFRPGHADYTYYKKYGIRDHNGGGRASARETAMRVAAGAIARKIIPQIQIKSAITQIGKIKINRDNWDWNEVGNNIFKCPDKSTALKWQTYLQEIQDSGDSVGAIIEVHVDNVPIGLGEPIYNKLDASLANAVMSINAIKAVEIGSGFDSLNYLGSEHNDGIFSKNGNVEFQTNNAGGILGGISNSDTIILKCAVKPTSSVASKQNTINTKNKNVNININGRHDPCIGIRAIYVVEAMIACVLADKFLLNKLSNSQNF